MFKRIRGIAVYLMLFFILSGLFVPVIYGDSEIQDDVFTSSDRKKLISLSGNDEVEAIIQFQDQITEADYNILHAMGLEIIYTYHIIPGVYAKGMVDSIKTLTTYSRLKRIDLNSIIEIDMELSLSVISAPEAWNREIKGSSEYSYIDGSDVTVVVVDTGIDAGHPDLDYGEKTIMNLFLNREEGYVWVEMENTDFDYGHGTHVAGTVAGNGDASAGARRGVAPGANLIGLTLVDPTVADYLISLEWVYDNSRPNANPHNIRAATNSWHSENLEHGLYDPDSPLTQVIEKLAFENNVVSTWSAGNHGRDDPEGQDGLTPMKGMGVRLPISVQREEGVKTIPIQILALQEEVYGVPMREGP
jgi:serine protease AprX